MAGFELTVWTAVQGYHIYKDSWVPTARENFVCYQECANEHDRHAVAVYKDGDSNDVLGHLPGKCSQVVFLFLEHDGSITDRVTYRSRYCRESGGMEISCKLTFSGKQVHIQKLRRFFDVHQFSCIECFH